MAPRSPGSSSLDHDGAAFDALCEADPVLAPVHAVAPGFRPALFYSPYEAAVWSVLSARRVPCPGHPRSGGGSAQALGATVELAGRPDRAVPTPSALLRLEALPGLPADRVPRLHAIAEAAAAGPAGHGDGCARCRRGGRRRAAAAARHRALLQPRSSSSAPAATPTSWRPGSPTRAQAVRRLYGSTPVDAAGRWRSRRAGDRSAPGSRWHAPRRRRPAARRDPGRAAPGHEMAGCPRETPSGGPAAAWTRRWPAGC